MKRKEKTAAIVTIFNASDMTKKGRRQIALWLKARANDLLQHGDELAGRFRARYLYGAILTIGVVWSISAAVGPSYAAEKPSAFALHGAVGILWREDWTENGGTPKWLELQPVIAGEAYLGSREYAKGWTVGGDVEFSVRRIDDHRALRFGIRREF